MEQNPKILVVGAGAIGAFYGSALARAGADVSVVVRSDYEALLKNPYTIKNLDGDYIFTPTQVLRQACDYEGNADYVIVATKVLPHSNTVDLIRDAVSNDTTIVLLQNGVEIEHDIQEAFPNNEIISGLCFICVSRIAPGVIDHQDYGHLVIGTYPNGITPKSELLGSLFNKAGIQCEVTENVVQARWKKLVWNAPYNPMSVLCGGVNTKIIMEDEDSVNLAREIMQEVYDVAKAVGGQFDHSFIQHNIDATLAMRPYKPSMLLDYEAGREMEVEAIIGNAVRAARRVGVKTPHIDSIYALLKIANHNNPYGK